MQQFTRRSCGLAPASSWSTLTSATSRCCPPVFRSSSYQLRQLRPVIQSMTAEAARTVAAAFISSRLDYCNSLLYGLPDTLLHKLQSVQNATARLITGTLRHDHITPVLRELHWLPIREHVKFKMACLVHQSLSGQAPLYLADDCCLVSNSARRFLRSADIPTCMVPRTYSSNGDRTFAAAGPQLFRSSCAIQSAVDCLDDSWRDIFLVNHERGILWLLDMWRLRKTLTYLLTYLQTGQV